MARVRIDGTTWLHALCRVGDLRWKHGADGGCLEASWNISLRSGKLPTPVLRRGALVEIFDGVVRVWVGILSEPGDDLSASQAAGPMSDAEKYLCLSGTAATANVDTGITQAIADGWRVTYRADAPTGIPKREPQYLHDAIAAAATGAGKRATVRADGILRFESDPTTPSYLLAPGLATLGRADEDWATHVYCYYVSQKSGTPSSPSAWATAVATAADTTTYGRSVEYVDLQDRDLLTPTQASQIAAGILAKTGARLTPTGGLTVSSLQLRDIGGQRAPLAHVEAGRMVRLLGVRTPEGSGMTAFDMVIGSVDYVDGSGQITLNPLGLAARNLADVIASIPTPGDRLPRTPGAGATAA